MPVLRTTTISVCTSCGDESGRPGAIAHCPGNRLFGALSARLVGADPALRVKAVPCMAVCERPVTIAYQAAGAWGYVIAGVHPDRDVEQVIAAAGAVAAAEHGVPAMADRPPFFRDGVVCRVPPVS